MSLPVTVEAMPKRESSLARGDEEENGAANEKPRETVAIDDLGIAISALTPEAAKELKMSEAKGVLVSSVKQGSLADEAGMHEGMVIERINKQAVTTPDEFRDAMKKVSLLKGFILDVRTPSGTQLMAIRKN
jgi:serine protease Do